MRSMVSAVKFIDTAQRIQRSIELIQTLFGPRETEVAAGGGAVRVKVNHSGRFTGLKLGPEFQREDAATISATIFGTIRDEGNLAKHLKESEMRKITSRFRIPGF